VLAVSGYSSGAQDTMQFAVSYPNFMDGILPMGGGAKDGTQGFFFGALYMSILETCAGWESGNYDQNPKQCAANALSTFVPYFYTREWWDQNIDTPEAYTNWRNKWGEYYLDIQDARDLYWNAGEFIPYLEAIKPVVVLAGVHSGCFEVFGNERVRSIRDIRGKTVAIMYYGGGDHILLSSMLAYVGINPREVSWVPGTSSLLDAMEVFASGKADAFVGFAQQPLELRARKIGKVIVNTSTDRPWSQYFCCMLGANRDFVQRYPVTTKRALRAILKAADICNSDPLKVARFLSDKQYEPRYQVGAELMKSLPYNRWREADPADTIRFHALRLLEVGMIKNNPEKLIAQGTNWRFLNELKKELKA